MISKLRLNETNVWPGYLLIYEEREGYYVCLKKMSSKGFPSTLVIQNVLKTLLHKAS